MATDYYGVLGLAPGASDTDIKRFTQLVRESIGLKDDRGDKLDVINQAFKTNPPIPATQIAALKS